jgi:hypothetical protein
VPWQQRFRKLRIGLLAFCLVHAMVRIPCYIFYVSWYRQWLESLPAGNLRSSVAFASGGLYLAISLIVPALAAIRCDRDPD